MSDVVVGRDGGIVVGVDEVDMIRGPAHDEDDDDESEHLDDLLLVVPALGEGGLGHQQPQGALVSAPEVSPHLEIHRFWLTIVTVNRQVKDEGYERTLIEYIDSIDPNKTQILDFF